MRIFMNLNLAELLLGNQKAEADIKEELSILVNDIVSRPVSSHIAAYILGGGFGRGEGSVILRDERYTTSNDYDMFAIQVDELSENDFSQMVQEIEEKYHLKFFGIDRMTRDHFLQIASSKTVSQADFDFMLGSKILWLNPVYKDDDLPSIFAHYGKEKREILLESAYRVLTTRFWCIVALTNWEDLTSLYDLQYVEDAQFFYFQQVKLATAIVDAVLIAEKRYDTPKFLEKLEVLKDTEFAKQQDIRLLVYLVREKIWNTNHFSLSIEERKELWNLYCSCVEFVMNFDKIRYAKFSIKEALHRKYAAIRHRKFNCWAVGDYEALRQLDIKKLKELQGKMRRMYA